MSIEIQNLKKMDYELICSIFDRKNNHNFHSKMLEFKFRNLDLILETYLVAKADYLIISANPILSNIVTRYLKQKKIKNVFVHNVFYEDSFNYKMVNEDFLDKLSETIHFPKKQDLYSFFKLTNYKNYCYTTETDIALSSSKKCNEDWIFSYIKHENTKNYSKEYVELWSNYQKAMKEEPNKWEVELKKGKFFYVVAKKIIILMNNNPYLLPELVNQKENVFVFDYKKHNGEKFEEDINAFLEIKNT